MAAKTQKQKETKKLSVCLIHVFFFLLPNDPNKIEFFFGVIVFRIRVHNTPTGTTWPGPVKPCGCGDCEFISFLRRLF